MTANEYSRTPFEIARSLLPGNNTARVLTLFVVRARFVGPAIHFVTAESRDIFLGNDGRWQSLEKTRPFKTHAAAETAAQEIRKRIRNTGNRTVSVSVLARSCDKWERALQAKKFAPAAN